MALYLQYYHKHKFSHCQSFFMFTQTTTYEMLSENTGSSFARSYLLLAWEKAASTQKYAFLLPGEAQVG